MFSDPEHNLFVHWYQCSPIVTAIAKNYSLLFFQHLKDKGGNEYYPSPLKKWLLKNILGVATRLII